MTSTSAQDNRDQNAINAWNAAVARNNEDAAARNNRDAMPGYSAPMRPASTSAQDQRDHQAAVDSWNAAVARNHESTAAQNQRDAMNGERTQGMAAGAIFGNISEADQQQLRNIAGPMRPASTSAQDQRDHQAAVDSWNAAVARNHESTAAQNQRDAMNGERTQGMAAGAIFGNISEADQQQLRNIAGPMRPASTSAQDQRDHQAAVDSWNAAVARNHESTAAQNQRDAMNGGSTPSRTANDNDILGPAATISRGIVDGTPPTTATPQPTLIPPILTPAPIVGPVGAVSAGATGTVTPVAGFTFKPGQTTVGDTRTINGKEQVLHVNGDWVGTEGLSNAQKRDIMLQAEYAREKADAVPAAGGLVTPTTLPAPVGESTFVNAKPLPDTGKPPLPKPVGGPTKPVTLPMPLPAPVNTKPAPVGSKPLTPKQELEIAGKAFGTNLTSQQQAELKAIAASMDAAKAGNKSVGGGISTSSSPSSLPFGNISASSPKAIDNGFGAPKGKK